MTTTAPAGVSAPAAATEFKAPAWLREVDGALPTTPQFVLDGNVRDQVLVPGEGGLAILRESVVDALWAQLAESGYEFFLIWDPVDGLRVHPDTDAAWEAAAQTVGQRLDRDGQPMGTEALRAYVAAVVDCEERRGAVIIDYASRIALSPERLSEEQHDWFVFAEKLAHEAEALTVAPGRPVALFNPVIWLVQKRHDLPGWFMTGNEGVRTTAVPLPDAGDRRRVARLLAGNFGDYAEAPEHEQTELVDRFTQQTDGMTLHAMLAIIRLIRDRGLGMREIEDAARAHRVGVQDNPWAREDLKERIANGEERLGGRVIGQPDAIRKSLDILMRSVTGLTGAHASPYATRPRGVLFFAGPTGVGKTELAKAITELVFWNQNAYTRFDMSEFSSSHNAERLLGAPPGYRGHDAGGELTNAVRERPFSLILFDEIDKADSRVLDKFLQILEDGRLTDGRGATVFFSEAILVFTSNLGVYVEDEHGNKQLNVTPDMAPEDVEHAIQDAIRDHFNKKLGRPELLNRLGDNIVVFDFIDRVAGEQIFDLLVRNIAKRVTRVHRATLTLAPAAREALLELALADLKHGGRGIGSVLENALVNPLARAIFERQVAPGDELVVAAIHPEGRAFRLELE